MNGCPFWYDGDPIGGVPGLLPWFGVFFIVGCLTPPPLQFRGGLPFIGVGNRFRWLRGLAGRVWGPGLRLFFSFMVGGLLGGSSGGWWRSVGALRAMIIGLSHIHGCVSLCCSLSRVFLVVSVVWLGFRGLMGDLSLLTLFST